MIMAGVLIFSIAVFIVSYLISKTASCDNGKLALSITLVAWGSLIVGLCISRIPQ